MMERVYNLRYIRRTSSPRASFRLRVKSRPGDLQHSSGRDAISDMHFASHPLT